MRTKVSSQTKIPKKRDDFLRDSWNKTELFSFLTERVASVNIPVHKTVYITSGMYRYVCMHAFIDA